MIKCYHKNKIIHLWGDQMKKIMILLNITLISLMIYFTYAILVLDIFHFRFVMVAILVYLVEAVVFLFSFMYMDIWILNKIYKVLKIYLIVITSLLVIIQATEWVMGWKFILFFSYRYVIYALLIYPLILTLLLKFSRYEENSLKKTFTTIASALTVLLLIFNGLLVGFNYKTVHKFQVDNPTYTFVIVEERMIFSSNHELYLIENYLFVSKIKKEGHWQCNDGCSVGNPLGYHWEWISEGVLEVSGGGLFEKVIYDLNG